MIDDMGNGLSSALENVKGWASHPFTTQMNLTGWFLFTGLVLVLVILWNLILKEITGDL